jgi:phosphoserine aminotransferase
MTRVFNFSAGPAVMPDEVLQEAAAEMLDWHGSGMSVMEMSHRGREFMSIIDNARADLRDLLAVPPEYRILFMQGGADEPAGPHDAVGQGRGDRLRADWIVVGKVGQRSKKICGGACRCEQRRRACHVGAGSGELAALG